MKNKTQRIQNIKTGQLFERYLNYEKGFAYVHSHDGEYENFYYQLSDLRIFKGRYQFTGSTFNPKEWRKYKLDLAPAKFKAREISQATGLPIATQKEIDNKNQFGGFRNGENKIEVSIWGKIQIVCTCSNCGDGMIYLFLGFVSNNRIMLTDRHGNKHICFEYNLDR